MSMEYRLLREEEIDRALLCDFERRQQVNRCWRREEGSWVIRYAPFDDQWSE